MEDGNREKKEYVSIVLPTYNRADKIGYAIESVLQQTYPYFELLIVDDGSTDDTENVVEQYRRRDDRIRYLPMAQNGGQSKARNYGISHARFDYIAFEDSDDLWKPKKLELQMRVMLAADQRAGMVYHSFVYNLGEGRQIVMPKQDIPKEKKSGNIYGQLLWDNMIGMPTLLLKRDCINTCGGLDENLRSLEDYDFVLRIAQKYEAVFIDEILLEAEFSNEGVSGNSGQYLIASCMLIKKYKQDYLKTNTLNHKLEIILRDAERLGAKGEIVCLLEKVLQM